MNYFKDQGKLITNCSVAQWLFATPWTAAHWAPLSMEFSRWEYLSKLPFPTPRYFPNPGIEPMSLASPALAGAFFTSIVTWEALITNYGSLLLPGKSHGRRSLVGCSPWGLEEPDTTERLHFHFSLSCMGEGNGNPRQCSCLGNPMDRGAWWPQSIE